MEHQLARLVLEVLRVEAKRGVSTRFPQFYVRLPSAFLLVWYLACCVLGDVFRALSVGVGCVGLVMRREIWGVEL